MARMRGKSNRAGFIGRDASHADQLLGMGDVGGERRRTNYSP